MVYLSPFLQYVGSLFLQKSCTVEVDPPPSFSFQCLTHEFFSSSSSLLFLSFSWPFPPLVSFSYVFFTRRAFFQSPPSSDFSGPRHRGAPWLFFFLPPDSMFIFSWILVRHRLNRIILPCWWCTLFFLGDSSPTPGQSSILPPLYHLNAFPPPILWKP